MLDTHRNGKRDAHVEPDQPMDPQKDQWISAASTRSWRTPSTVRCGVRSVCSPKPSSGHKLPRERFSRVPSMFASLGVEVPYPT